MKKQFGTREYVMAIRADCQDVRAYCVREAGSATQRCVAVNSRRAGSVLHPSEQSDASGCGEEAAPRLDRSFRDYLCSKHSLRMFATRYEDCGKIPDLRLFAYSPWRWASARTPRCSRFSMPCCFGRFPASRTRAGWSSWSACRKTIPIFLSDTPTILITVIK